MSRPICSARTRLALPDKSKFIPRSQYLAVAKAADADTTMSAAEKASVIKKANECAEAIDKAIDNALMGIPPNRSQYAADYEWNAVKDFWYVWNAPIKETKKSTIDKTVGAKAVMGN